MTNEIQETAADWWGQAGTKVAVYVMCALLAGAGYWMLEMRDQLVSLNVKMETVVSSIQDNKAAATMALEDTRDNIRRLDRIESTRFTWEDAKKNISPLERRLDALEALHARSASPPILAPLP